MPGCVLTPDPGDLMLSPRLTCVRVSSGDHLLCIHDLHHNVVTNKWSAGTECCDNVSVVSGLAYLFLASVFNDLRL